MTIKRRFATFAGLALGVSTLLGGAALAQGVPQPPDFTTVYGTVQENNNNVTPAEQPVIAFVNGQACGTTDTLVAGPEPGNEADAGKTVFTVDVMANGTGLFQRPGCGTIGQAISFYLPLSGKMATEALPFAGASFERLNLTLSTALTRTLTIPASANDGTP